jgi:hypothetical protein
MRMLGAVPRSQRENGGVRQNYLDTEYGITDGSRLGDRQSSVLVVIAIKFHRRAR